tara:strand:+ start:2369 stop:4165 length:1797 start_codon:yes stop_codon:yes gene_type:complete
MTLFKKNLKTLHKYDSGLARRFTDMPFPENVSVVESKTGHSTLKVDSINLHSVYRPLEEAARMVSGYSFKSNSSTIVYGLGFGYHVLQILEKTKSEVIVVEPLTSVFRAFLSYVDLEKFFPRVHFVVGEPPAKVANRHGKSCPNIYTHRPSFRLCGSYFNKIDKCIHVGEFLNLNRLRVMVINPIYGGSLPTAKHCFSAFKNLGHEVCSVDCEDYADSFKAIQEVTTIKKNAQVISERFLEMMSDIILSKAVEFKPDFILGMAQAPLRPATIERLKALDIPIAFWFVEDFRTLTYWKEVAGSYDYFFSIQRDSFFDELEEVGVKNYYYLPQACAPKVHAPLNLKFEERSKFEADLSFMGASYYNRRKAFPRLLDFDFKVWGTGWQKDNSIVRRLQNDNERVSTEDCVKIYNSAKVNLNLHSSTCHEEINHNGDFVNPRTFEIAACGGFQLVDERSELFELFDVGKEIVTYRSINELRELISYYLHNEKERKIIATNARARVLKDHTFETRLREMLLFIYQDKLELLQTRLESRQNGRDVLINQAGKNTELGKYIGRFKDKKQPTLREIIDNLEKQEGILSENELLLLMVDQVVKEVKG